MRRRIWLFVLLLATETGVPRAARMEAQATDGEKSCPVTKAPNPAFVPPAPFRASSGPGSFPYGTPKLWAIVPTEWRLGLTANKLPYFREGFDLFKENDPRMAVVARRLDGPAPMVWAKWVNSGLPDGKTADSSFMVTSLDIPSAGCWEISAHYNPTRDNIQTLTYTVWVGR
jgi:hypothetical protein